MKKQTIYKTISILFGITLALLIAEVGFRVLKYASYYSLNDVTIGQRDPIFFPNDNLTLGQIIKLSNNNKIIYELLPSSEYLFKGVNVKTNSKGFRDKEYSEEKKSKTKRIIGLGDSVMFGWGMEEPNCYLSVLEKQLNNNFTFPIEIINTGVPGYNTAMEVATLEEKFDLNEVDMVLIHYVGNDFDLPNFIRRKPDFFQIKKSYILMYFSNNEVAYDSTDNRLSHAPRAEDGGFERDPKDVPDIYQELVGKEGYKKSMKQLEELSKEYGFEVVIFVNGIFDPVPEVVTTCAEQAGFPLINFAPNWWNFKSQHPEILWKISDHDWHPRKEGHQVIADALMPKVVEILSKGN